MATTKSRQTFYAVPAVEEKLSSIPPQLKSYWINKTLSEAIDHQSRGTKSELSEWCDWLKKQDGASKTYDVIAEVIEAFLTRAV
ncbi:MAG: hypothetical protein K2X81_25535 [Candidatus Obscuribacterales bacterium]|nr:hypothetical protein [Candidatus Obscuribacterales bacterium]